MPSSRNSVSWGLQRFRAIPLANAHWCQRQSTMLSYDMALAKLNKQVREKMAAIEARLKEKRQKEAEDVEVFVDGPVDVARHLRGDRVVGAADGMSDEGGLLRGTQPAD